MPEGSDLLFRRRGVTSDWYYDQARDLLNVALQFHSATTMVYAAFEARNALERFVLEMSLLATGGRLTEDQVRSAQNRDGAFRLLENAMSNYRHRLEFSNNRP